MNAWYVRLMVVGCLSSILVACGPGQDADSGADTTTEGVTATDLDQALSLEEMVIKQQYASFFDETMSDEDIIAMRAVQAQHREEKIDALLLKMDDMIASGLATTDGQLSWSRQTFHQLASEHPDNAFAPVIGPMIITMCKAPIKFRRFIKKLTNYEVVGTEAPEVIYDTLRRTVGGLVGPWEVLEKQSLWRAFGQGEYALKDGFAMRIIQQIRNSKGDYNYLVAIVDKTLEATADDVIDQYVVSNIFNLENLQTNVAIERYISNMNLNKFYKSVKTTDTVVAFNNYFEGIEKKLRQAAAMGLESADLDNTLKAMTRFKQYKNLYQFDIVRTELDQLAGNKDFLKQVKKLQIDASALRKMGEKYDSYLKIYSKENDKLFELMKNSDLMAHIQTNDYLENNSQALLKRDKDLYKKVNKYSDLMANRSFDNFDNMRPKRIGYQQSFDEAAIYEWFNEVKTNKKSNPYKKMMKAAKKKFKGPKKTKVVPIHQSQDIVNHFANKVRLLDENIASMEKNLALRQELLTRAASKGVSVQEQKALLLQNGQLLDTIKAQKAEIRLQTNAIYELKRKFPTLLKEEIDAYAEVLPRYAPAVDTRRVLREPFVGEILLPGIGDDQYVGRIMKKMNVQADGSADYIVSIVNRSQDAPVGMVDQYLIQGVYDQENLVKKIVNLREKSIGSAGDIWSKMMASVDGDAWAEKLANLESKGPQSARNLFDADRNLFNLDVLMQEIKGAAIGDDTAIQTMIDVYQQEIEALMQRSLKNYNDFIQLQKNPQLKAFFIEIMTRSEVDNISPAVTEQRLLRETPELREVVTQYNDLFNHVNFDLDELNIRSKNLNLAQTFNVDEAFNWYPKNFREHLNAFLDRLLNRKVADANMSLFDINLDPIAIIDDGEVINIPRTNPGYRPPVPVDGAPSGSGGIDLPPNPAGTPEVDLPIGSGGVDVPPTGGGAAVDDLIITTDKTLGRRLVKAMQALAVDVGVELLASSYAIYTLDGAYYARTYAERNKQAAIATSMLFESLAGVGVSATIYLTEASGVMPVLIPLAIFLGVGITTSILLDKRYDKMEHAQKAQLFLHQLYHKYFVVYNNPRNLYQLSRLTGAQVLVTAKDSDVLVDRLDLSGATVQVNQVGTLHLPLMDKHDTLLEENINVMDYWRRIGIEPPSDDLNKSDGENEFYTQLTLPNRADEDVPAYQIPSAEVDALVLPGQPKFIDPWERRVITTKKGGVYAKNYQLGARLALTLERTLFTNFKPYFFMQENRHLYQINHDKRQLLPTTDVTVMLPKQTMDILLPHGVWISPFLPYMAYRISAPEQPNQYYGFHSDYFKPLKAKGAVEGTLVRLELNSSSRDIFWDMTLMGLNFDEGATLTQKSGQLVIAQGAKKIVIDTKRLTGHLIINGLLGDDATIRYVRLQNGEVKSNRLQPADQALYMQLKQAHLDKVAKRPQQSPQRDEPEVVEPTTLFISNATWEKGEATITYDDDSTDVVNIADEDTTQVNLYRPVESIASMTFKTTKSVKYKANPTRTLSKAVILDYLMEGIPMMCYQLNQGQMARDFRATPELCTANMPSYISGKESLSPALGDDKRLLYKIDHVDVNNPKARVKYYKFSIDNQSNLEIYMTIRYAYQGKQYRLVVDEKLLPWQKIQYLKSSIGSRADFYIPAGATLLSLRAERLLKDDLFNVFTTLEDSWVGQTMNQDRYLDINKRLLRQATMVDIDEKAREKRYLDSYRNSKQVFENMQYVQQHMRY